VVRVHAPAVTPCFPCRSCSKVAEQEFLTTDRTQRSLEERVTRELRNSSVDSGLLSTSGGKVKESSCMSEAETYDTRVQAIRVYNHSLLEGFGAWLEHKGWTSPTIITHLGNIYLFASYLVYAEPLKKLDEATESDVYWFLADWFPRKALWASVHSVQAYCASFKKFFQWMGETSRVSPEIVAEVISTLKEERNVFLAQVAE